MRTVREIANMGDGYISAMVLLSLEKLEEFSVAGKKYRLVSVTKRPKRKKMFDITGKLRFYDKTFYKTKNENGKTITSTYWEWDNGNSGFHGCESNSMHENLSRDMESDVMVDLINENNPFHTKSDSYRLVERYLLKQR